LFSGGALGIEPVAVVPSNVSPFTNAQILTVDTSSAGTVAVDLTLSWAPNFVYADFRINLVVYCASEQVAYFKQVNAFNLADTIIVNVPAGVETERLVCFVFATKKDENGKKLISEAIKATAN
jgi:hypothetical protein